VELISVDDINGQLGVILEKIKRVREDVQEIKAEMARREDVEGLRGQFIMLKADHEERLRQVEGQNARSGERQKIVGAGLAGLTLLASSVAAWLGMQK